MQSLEKLKKYKVAIIIGSISIIAFIVFSIAMFTINHSTNVESSPTPEIEQTDIQPANVNKEYTSAQQDLINNYSDAEKTFIGTLISNVWTADKESKVISFEENKYTEHSTKDKDPVPFAVAALEKKSDGNSGTNYIATLLYKDGSFGILTLQELSNNSPTSSVSNNTSASSSNKTVSSSTSVSSKTPTKTYTLSCDKFENSKNYNRSKASDNLSVGEMNETANQFIKGYEKEATAAIRDYCSIHFPTAKNATWNNKIVVNYNSKTVSYNYVVDNAANSAIDLNYSMETHEFGVTGSTNNVDNSGN